MISYRFGAKGTANVEVQRLTARAVEQALRDRAPVDFVAPEAAPPPAEPPRAAPAAAPATAPAPAPATAPATAPSAAPAPAAAAAPLPPAVPHATGQQILSNLLAHIPSEAVALSTSLGPLVHDATNKVMPVRAWLVLLGALALTVLVRWLNNASAGVWITSLLAFGLWMSLVPGGAIQATFEPVMRLQVELLILAAIFSAVVTTLATAGKLK